MRTQGSRATYFSYDRYDVAEVSATTTIVLILRGGISRAGESENMAAPLVLLNLRRSLAPHLQTTIAVYRLSCVFGVRVVGLLGFRVEA